MAVHRRASRRRYVLLLLVLTSLTLITLDRRRDDDGVLGAVGRAAHTVVSPVERATAAVVDPIDDWLDGVLDGASIERENERLRRELAEVQDQQRRAEAALAQNEIFRQLADLPILDDVERVTGRVVNRAAGNFEWTITIDKGSGHGISAGMPVVGPAGVVGKVIEAWDGGAKVRLLIDRDSFVSVFVLVEDTPNVSGIAQGRGASERLRVELDAEAPVTADDVVVTSGLENSDFPEGLSIGEVVEVEERAAGLGKVATVRPWSDFDALEIVQVLRWVPGQGPVVSTTTTTTPPATTTTTAPTTGGGGA